MFHLLYILIRFFGKKESKLIFDRVLVLAPHPDDEILGLGGSILRMMEEGTNIHIVYLTDGENSGVWPDKEEIKNQRLILSEKVCNSLGLDKRNITRLHLPDGDVPHPGQPGFEVAVKTIKDIIEAFGPDAVFSTHPLDYWPFDHVACSNIAFYAIRQSQRKCQLWYYWVWAWYNMRPRSMMSCNYKSLYKIRINNELPRKAELMNFYLNTLTPNGKPWSGIMPESLIKAFYRPIEVLEKIN